MSKNSEFFIDLNFLANVQITPPKNSTPTIKNGAELTVNIPFSDDGTATKTPISSYGNGETRSFFNRSTPDNITNQEPFSGFNTEPREFVPPLTSPTTTDSRKTANRRSRKLSKQQSTSSFVMNIFATQSNNSMNNQAPVEELLNYLSENIEKCKENTPELKKLEALTAELLREYQDAKIVRILKENGWTGARFKPDETSETLDLHFLLQALSNYYLHLKKLKLHDVNLSDLLGREADETQGLENLVPFCPDVLMNYLKHNHFPPTPSLRPVNSSTSNHSMANLNQNIDDVPCICFRGACMLVDISGFSKFSGAMCSKGVNGLDELRNATNGFLGHFVKLVYDYNGDVIAFAGDALICTFLDLDDATSGKAVARTQLPARPERGTSKEINTLVSNCCYRAMQCADILKGHEASSSLTAMSLSTHIGLSYGDMRMALLGGLNDQYVYVMNGACVSALSSCVTDALSKQVVVTKECLDYALKHRHVDHTEVPNSTSTSGVPNYLISGGESMARPKNTSQSHRESFHERIDLIQQYYAKEKELKTMSGSDGHLEDKVPSDEQMTPRPHSASNPSTVNSNQFDLGNETAVQHSQRHFEEDEYERDAETGIIMTDFNAGTMEADAKFIENIAMFVPVVILAAACSGTMENLGELRQVTTVFIELKSYDPILHSDPRCLQPFFSMAQQCLVESGGFLRQFLVDDKGCVLIAMWGTPSFTYSNNSCRALYFAVTVSQKALELGHSLSAGVTTGTVFCGTVGAVERCDYAGVGTDVNMAARLMGKAEGGVLIDNLTYSNLHRDLRSSLTEMYPMTLKGSAEPVIPYKYTSLEAPAMKAANDQNESSGVFLKRKICNLIETLLDKASGSVTLLARRASSKGSEKGRFTLARMYSTATVVSSPKGSVDVLVVTGSTGSGKTVAANYCRHAAVKRGLQAIMLTCTGALRGIPYGIISQLFFELLPFGKKDGYVSGEGSFVSRLVEDCYPYCDPMLVDYIIKQLETLLGLNVDDERTKIQNELLDRTCSDSYDDVTAIVTEPAIDMMADEDLPTLSSIIYHVLVTLLKAEKTVLIVENFHLCDELSWHELLQIFSLKEQQLALSVLLTVRIVPLNENKNKIKITAALREMSSESSENSPISIERSDSNISLSESRHQMVRLGPKNAKSPRANSANSANNSSNAIVSNFSQSTINLVDSYNALLKLPDTIMHELTPLNSDEVRFVLDDALGAERVTNDLVALVTKVSLGNIYWCKSIASFIIERDINEFQEIMGGQQSTKGYNNPLKDLVLCRMEKLSNEIILMLKYMSVIGQEFTEDMITAIMKPMTPITSSKPNTPSGASHGSFFNKINDSLHLLERNGFIYLLDEDPTPIYGFQNDLIRTTVFELLTPSDAATIHILIAEYLEKEFYGDLRPFYTTLAFHYTNGGKKVRPSAFKYQMKAANHAINHGAFTEGLGFCQTAALLAERRVEHQILVEVINNALNGLVKLLPRFGLARSNALGSAAYGGPASRKNSSTPDVDNTEEDNSHRASRTFQSDLETEIKMKMNAYTQLKANCTIILNKMKVEADLAQANSPNVRQSQKNPRDIMAQSKGSKSKLSWRLSNIGLSMNKPQHRPLPKVPSSNSIDSMPDEETTSGDVSSENVQYGNAANGCCSIS